MRRILLPALICALIVGCFAGVASARLASSPDVGGPAPAPFTLPSTAPRPDADQAGAWSYRRSATIGAALEGAAATSTAPAAAGTSASVTVTATVLPVVFIVLDADHDVQRLVTNTTDRDARNVLFVFRTGSEQGAAVTLTPEIWAATRAALGATTAGSGTVWGD